MKRFAHHLDSAMPGWASGRRRISWPPLRWACQDQKHKGEGICGRDLGAQAPLPLPDLLGELSPGAVLVARVLPRVEAASGQAVENSVGPPAVLVDEGHLQELPRVSEAAKAERRQLQGGLLQPVLLLADACLRFSIREGDRKDAREVILGLWVAHDIKLVNSLLWQRRVGDREQRTEASALPAKGRTGFEPSLGYLTFRLRTER